ncbi:multicopper oxidase family protein [Micromonospora echinaurantiaca]|uniref:multicopper oxidase family protein n=1 Tax=Micromonospora echinaurantiaca TaxID=47857 RepID=UPI001E3F0F6B|nr:multicopper oxidase domain-containing protein [Micromonospora echinaurantiaca]
MKRRDLLVFAGLAALAGCGSPGSASKGNSGTLTFANRLRVPPLLEPVVTKDGTRQFSLTMQAGRTELLPGRPTATWGFNGPFLGPTVRAKRGDRVAMRVHNKLGEPSTVHWHGMRLPAAMDGGPHQMIEPGGTWTPRWTIDQPAATSWYHPHPHGTTAAHVYRGLAGLFLLDDPATAALGLPSTYGVDDVPLVLQDKILDPNGVLLEDPKPTWGLIGDQILVNGVHDPFFEVTTTLVRLRILNGSSARMYHVEFADRRRFHVIGTDAGLLAAPVPVERVQLSPGERLEILVEFAPRDQVVLRSVAGDNGIDEGDYDLLKFVAADRLTPRPPVPGRLAATPRIEVPADARERRFRLSGSDEINGREMDMARIDEVVPAGATEIWHVENTVYAHNFHIHEVAFEVLDIDGQQPPAYLRGPKDTVFVPGKSTVRLAVQFGHFTDPKTPYMYHCHILRHEDKGMMGQFVIVRPGTEASVPRTLPTHHHHG